MTQPLISIIVPVYNVEPYISKCVDSLLTQTYTHLEILLVNDGSTDASGALCDCYAEKDGRVRVIHQENKGLSAARNRGVQESNGEYIAFVDSDDYVVPTFIEALYSSIQTFGTELAICGFYYVNTKGVIRKKMIYPAEERSFERGMKVVSAREYIYHYLVQRFVSATAWNRLYSRRLALAVPFPEGRLFEDAYTYVDFASTAKTIAIVRAPLYYYVEKRPNSITETITLKGSQDHIYGHMDAAKKICKLYPELTKAAGKRLRGVMLREWTRLEERKSSLEDPAEISEMKAFQRTIRDDLLPKTRGSGFSSARQVLQFILVRFFPFLVSSIAGVYRKGQKITK